MVTLGSFGAMASEWKETGITMPVLFIGHGSPMNAIEDNEFSRGWHAVAATLPRPRAILVISAHWETRGTFVTAMERPKTIHDFGGFPQALFDVQYNAPGSPDLAQETKQAITTTPVGLDESWGLDHGTWSVLVRMYPEADIPVVQLSLDYTRHAQYHYDLAKQIAVLRKKGVLIIGSGNMVHNFRYLDARQGFEKHYGHDWALDANDQFKKLITTHDHKPLIDYQANRGFALSAPTPEHYLPMLYTLAIGGRDEPLQFFNDAVVAGSFSMTSFRVG